MQDLAKQRVLSGKQLPQSEVGIADCEGRVLPRESSCRLTSRTPAQLKSTPRSATGAYLELYELAKMAARLVPRSVTNSAPVWIAFLAVAETDGRSGY